MRYHIDPTIDCVFKALLGSSKNINLLLHFLNAVLSSLGGKKICEVHLLNPYNLKEFLSDKLTIVDVKAVDEDGTTYQIEIQLVVSPHLRKRMLYTWCDLYASQLSEGDKFDTLNPVISIWLLPGKKFIDTPAWHHCYALYDRTNREAFDPGSTIHVIEWDKWCKPKVVTELDRWTVFFREGKNLSDEDLPHYMETPEMRQAMSTLREFSEKQKERLLYLSRKEYLLEQNTMNAYLQEAQKELEKKRGELEKNRGELEKNRGELELSKEALVQSREETLRERERSRAALQTAQEEREKAVEAQLAQKRLLQQNERMAKLLRAAGLIEEDS